MSEEPKVKILIVDDLPEKLLVYQVILEELGQELISARSGTEALRHVLNHDFAVILLDVNMPDVDGIETAALIRSRKRSAHTPIIFITAFADEVRINEGYASGAVDYIQAPVVPEVLRAKVKVFVDLFRMTERVKRQAEERIALAEERSRRAAAEEANRQLEFLVEAGGVLAKSLDSQVTAENVARVIVPELADRVVIAQMESGTSMLTCIDAEGVDDGLRFQNNAGLESLPVHWTAAVERVLTAGISEYLSPPDASLGEPATIILPLHARGRTFGVLCLSREPSRRTFAPADLRVAMALSTRSSIAMDNSRLYRDVEQADRHKNEFLSMLAHELRNPLAPIRNAVAVLRQGGDGEAIAWAEDIIDRQVTQLVRIVDDLLDLSRITQGKIRLELERVDIASVAASAVETSRPLIDTRRHQLQVQLPTEPLIVDADQARLSQVLSNLLNNAAKYTPDNGRIWLGVTREGEQAVIRIRDTGIGIPPDLLAKVFDLFTQADTSLDRAQGGLGIGLTLVKRLVEMQGGTVEVASAGTGKGSEFTVRLPAIGSQPVKAPARRSATEAASAEKLRIIAVDDNQDAADTLAQFLRIQGHDVRVLYEGQGVAELVEEFRPQVVILDLGLPGMSGYDVAKRLTVQPSGEDLLLVALSGYGRAEDIQRSRECGFHHHFVKPLDIKAMMRLLATAPIAKTSTTD